MVGRDPSIGSPLGLLGDGPSPLVEEAHRFGAKVKIAPRTTELLLQRAEYIPGEGTPLFELRPPALAGSEWALKRGFDAAVPYLVNVITDPAAAYPRSTLGI